jgi:hypothetical protein
VSDVFLYVVGNESISDSFTYSVCIIEHKYMEDVSNVETCLVQSVYHIIDLTALRFFDLLYTSVLEQIAINPDLALVRCDTV